MSPPSHYDAIVIGAGHNGLTAAGYLGKGGLRTLVVERRHVVGGAVVTEEFHPGYRNSVAAYVVSLLRAEVIRDLELKKHGLHILRFKGSLEICGDDHLLLLGDASHDHAEVARFSNRDYEAIGRFETMIETVGEVVREQYLREPPDLRGGLTNLLTALRVGRGVRKLSPEMRHRLVQLFTTSAADIVERWFESPMVRSMYASHCMSGNFSSFYQPGSAIPFFHHALGELDGERGAWGVPKGGMGAITQAMASYARGHGVEIRTAAPVERIVVERGRATGVRLENGEEIRALVVLANTDPKRTFLRLVGREHLPSEFADDIEHLRMGHASLRMNLALEGLPRFSIFPGDGLGVHHQCNVMIFQPLQTMEAGYHVAVAGGLPQEPRLDVVMPSALDDSLAPPGHHVMSVLAKYYPYRLCGERRWDDTVDSVADHIIDYMTRWMPNLKDLVVGRQVLSPLDLERVFGLTEGDIFHGRHDPDQIFSLRPHPSAARYATPVDGLYLCGSGAHPGGAVSGAPGHNAARRVLKDLKRSLVLSPRVRGES